MDNQYYNFSSSFPLCIITFLVFVFMVFKIWPRKEESPRPWKLPPGPWKLPVIGHLHHLLFSDLSVPHQCLRDLARKHGPSLMHLKLGEVSHFVVSSPEAAKQVLKTHDLNFANRPPLAAARIIFYNFTDIAWSSYGGYWKQLRKVCSTELFSPARVQSLGTVREEEVSNLIKSISLISSSIPNAGEEAVNLTEMLSSLGYAITLRAAFGGRMCKQPEAFILLMKRILRAATGFSVADLFPSIKLLHVLIGSNAQLERLHREADEMLETIIQEHRISRIIRAKNDENEEMVDLVDVLLNLQDDGGLEFPITADTIKGIILDLLMAGTDTPATVTEWSMSEIMKNPRVLKKAQAEVRQVFDKSGGDIVKEPRQLDELKYLKLVIMETLRLHSPAPLLLPRQNRERCEINGYEIPPNSKVIINAWAIGRDPNYWDEAEVFNPERFVDSSIDSKGANFEYIPFGAGRRMCPGMPFGTAIVELTLANLLYHFDWKFPNGMTHEDLDMTEIFDVGNRRKTDLLLIPIPYQHAPSV